MRGKSIRFPGWFETPRCPECGYELGWDEDECPNCGAIMGDYEEFSEFKQ
jgi:rubrerythrin